MFLFFLVERQCKIQQIVERRPLTAEQIGMLSSFSYQYVIPHIAHLSKRYGLIFCSQATSGPATDIGRVIHESGFNPEVWCLHPHDAEAKLKEDVTGYINTIAENCALLFIFCLFPSNSAKPMNTEFLGKLITHVTTDAALRLQAPMVGNKSDCITINSAISMTLFDLIRPVINLIKTNGHY